MTPQTKIIKMIFTEKKRVAKKAASMTAMGSQRFFFRMGHAILMTTSKTTAATPASIPAIAILTYLLERNA